MRKTLRKFISGTLRKTKLGGVKKELERAWHHFRWQRSRKFGRVDKELYEEYFENHKTKKLHIGCGYNFLEGWLNTDLAPISDNIFHLDATEAFPFCDAQFDYIFSEHMIEHITFPQGMQMLAECFRVLRENGKMRISTPDLQFLFDLYGEEKTERQKQYVRWATDSFIKSAPRDEDTFVINNFVRAWHHQFIYDEKILRISLESAGFTDIGRCKLNESEHETLQALENERRMPAGFLELETMTLEGTKPALNRRTLGSQ